MSSDIRAVRDNILAKVQTEIGAVDASVTGASTVEQELLDEWQLSLRTLRQYISAQFAQLERDAKPVQREIRREPDGDLLWA